MLRDTMESKREKKCRGGADGSEMYMYIPARRRGGSCGNSTREFLTARTRARASTAES